MSKFVRYEIINTIGVITIAKPPINALCHDVRMGLQTLVADAEHDESRALLILGAGGIFSAGADISEFGKPPLAPSLADIIVALEKSRKLIVAAINGTALGGGFELALACHYRCATPGALVGLPEVKLGLLPGAGGTQRVPRLAGVEAALELIMSGNPISVSDAVIMGLIDKVLATSDLLAGALAYAQDLVACGAELKRVRDITIDRAPVAPEFFDTYRRKFASRARGQIAPDRIISAVEAAVILPLEQGLVRERELFMELLQSPESHAMRHIFFATRAAAKLEGLPVETPVRDIQRVAIIGAGTMGSGIAMCFANASIPVTMLEISNEALQRGMDFIRKNYRLNVGKGKLSETEMQERLLLIDGTTAYADLAAVDLVIEAVFEDPEIKKKVFAQLDAVCKPDAILASNTSFQNIDDIAAVTTRARDVVGMHFFSPANVMKLLEVVRGAKTANDVLATVMQIGKKIGKVCVLSRVGYGFIGNRMLSGYIRQAHMLLLNGASPLQVDTAAEKFGMAMGPFAMSDLAGLDVGYKARQALAGSGEVIDPATHCIATALVERGRLGQKSGAGYYKYDPDNRTRESDSEVDELIRYHSAKLGVVRRDISNAEIVARLLYSLINEAALILEEGIAQRPGDIDVVYVYGYAFPSARGGPMFYADAVGLRNIYDSICGFSKGPGGEYWQPAPLLQKLAQADSTFLAWCKSQG